MYRLCLTLSSGEDDDETDKVRSRLGKLVKKQEPIASYFSKISIDSRHHGKDNCIHGTFIRESATPLHDCFLLNFHGRRDVGISISSLIDGLTRVIQRPKHRSYHLRMALLLLDHIMSGIPHIPSTQAMDTMLSHLCLRAHQLLDRIMIAMLRIQCTLSHHHHHLLLLHDRPHMERYRSPHLWLLKYLIHQQFQLPHLKHTRYIPMTLLDLSLTGP